MRDLESFVLIQSMFGDKLGEKGTIHAPRNVVPC
jgi:hypothetical protein